MAERILACRLQFFVAFLANVSGEQGGWQQAKSDVGTVGVAGRCQLIRSIELYCWCPRKRKRHLCHDYHLEQTGTAGRDAGCWMPRVPAPCSTNTCKQVGKDRILSIHEATAPSGSRARLLRACPIESRPAATCTNRAPEAQPMPNSSKRPLHWSNRQCHGICRTKPSPTRPISLGAQQSSEEKRKTWRAIDGRGQAAGAINSAAKRPFMAGLPSSHGGRNVQDDTCNLPSPVSLAIQVLE